MNASDAKLVIPFSEANAMITNHQIIDSPLTVSMLNMMKTNKPMSVLNVITVMLLPPIVNNVYQTMDHVHTLIVQTVLTMNNLNLMKKFKLNVLMKEKAAALLCQLLY